jgi:enoyl-CoA hydratase
VAVRLALEAIRRGPDLPLPEAQRLEAELFGRCCESEDFREGTRAFMEKRPPVFVNR